MCDNNKNHVDSAITKIFFNNGALLRLIILIIVLVAISLFSLWIINKMFMEQFAVVSFEPGGTVVFETKGGKKASFTVPASEGWINTGFELEANKKYEVRASGYINLSIHHQVYAANNDTRPHFGWIGPDGREAEGEGKYKRRNKLLIDKSSNVGKLLAFLRYEQAGEQPHVIYNPRPGPLIKLGSRSTLENPKNQPATLWLIVNDSVLDGSLESKNAYMPTKVELIKKKTQEVNELSEKLRNLPGNICIQKDYIEEKCLPQDYINDLFEKFEKDKANLIKKANIEYGEELSKWENIKKLEYWNLWYDDNAGSFNVTITPKN